MKRVIPGKWICEGTPWVWRVDRDESRITLHVDGEEHALELQEGGEGAYRVTDAQGVARRVVVTSHRGECWVTLEGRTWRLESQEGARRQSSGPAGDGQIKSPMPGKVVAIEVSPGEEVGEGALVAVVEAMKMEHPLRAPFDGEVAAVNVEAGDGVGSGEVLLVIQRRGDE